MKQINRVGPRRSLSALAAVLTMVLAARAQAFSSGITTSSFGVNGCNQCHSGGTAPTVALTGPTEVAPGSTNEYTFQIFAPAGQLHGGLNVSSPDGVFSVGGANSSQTQTLPNSSLVLEITHTSPKAADASDTVTFSFLWTAPDPFTTATLSAWGNAVNLNHSPSGDKAAMTTLVISALADTPTPTDTPEDTPTPTAMGDTPTPTDTPETPVPTSTPTLTPTVTLTSTATSTPTATPTPTLANPCAGDVTPKKPLLISDGTAEHCQEGIAKAGFLYAKARFNAVQKCLKKFQQGSLTGDPVAVCRGTLAVPPTDGATKQLIDKAETKALAAIDGDCPNDAAVAALDACGETVADVKTCIISTHFQVVEDALTAEYGTLVPTTDKAEQTCQAGIGKGGGNYFVAKLHAIQKCLNKRNKKQVTGDPASICMDPVVGGVPLAPTDGSTANKLVKAEAKLRALINNKCSDAQVAQLDACGTDRASVADCLVCNHRIGVFGGLASEYGGD